MKLNLATILSTTMAVTVIAAPAHEALGITTRDTKVDQVDGAHVNFITTWPEDGMNRWRWEYGGASCDDFKNAAKTTAAGRINNNQCTEENGKTVFDSNQSVGKAGDTHIIRAMKELTGQPCCDMGLPDWGLDTCLEMFRTSDDCDMTQS